MKPVVIAVLLVLLAVGLGVGYLVFRPAPTPIDPALSHQAQETASTSGYYTCPMHPSVRSDRPGACPMCGMALVRRDSGATSTDTTVHMLGAVTLSPSQQVLANVTLLNVRRTGLVRTLRTVGTLQDAEPTLGHVTLRYPGRIERLHVGFTGARVARGEAIADVYSPEAISAQREYLLALESAEATKDAYQDIAASAQDLLAQSRQKLERWGFSQGQIATLTSLRAKHAAGIFDSDQISSLSLVLS